MLGFSGFTQGSQTAFLSHTQVAVRRIGPALMFACLDDVVGKMVLKPKEDGPPGREAVRGVG
jgi:hypothetical protein